VNYNEELERVQRELAEKKAALSQNSTEVEKPKLVRDTKYYFHALIGFLTCLIVGAFLCTLLFVMIGDPRSTYNAYQKLSQENTVANSETSKLDFIARYVMNTGDLEILSTLGISRQAYTTYVQQNNITSSQQGTVSTTDLRPAAQAFCQHVKSLYDAKGIDDYYQKYSELGSLGSYSANGVSVSIGTHSICSTSAGFLYALQTNSSGANVGDLAATVNWPTFNKWGPGMYFINHGLDTKIENVQVGDFLWFKTSSTTGHVETIVYIDGNTVYVCSTGDTGPWAKMASGQFKTYSIGSPIKRRGDIDCGILRINGR
jgi:hypothetical protein